MSHNRRRIRAQNPKGLHLAFLKEITLQDAYTGPAQLQWLHARYVRFALHAVIDPIRQYREMKHKWRWIAVLPASIGAWLGDRLRRLMPSTRRHRK